MNRTFYYLTYAYQNLEYVQLKLNILSSIYSSIVNEWQLHVFNTELEKSYFTYHQYALYPFELIKWNRLCKHELLKQMEITNLSVLFRSILKRNKFQ